MRGCAQDRRANPAGSLALVTAVLNCSAAIIGGSAALRVAADPLAPGSVYAASVSYEERVGLYRVGVGVSQGTGKLRVAGGTDGVSRESFQRAFAYLRGHKKELGIAQFVDTADFHVETID